MIMILKRGGGGGGGGGRERRGEREREREREREYSKCTCRLTVHFQFTYHTTFELSRSDAMTFDIDDIIHPAGDLVVSILISESSVSCEVEPGVGGGSKC